MCEKTKEINTLKELIADLVFAYENKDEECSHCFEIATLNKATAYLKANYEGYNYSKGFFNALCGKYKASEIGVSDIAVNSWKALCRKYTTADDETVVYKIVRAWFLGQIIYIFKDDYVVVRYHDLNILANKQEIRAIWRDTSTKKVDVSEDVKSSFDEWYIKS